MRITAAARPKVNMACFDDLQFDDLSGDDFVPVSDLSRSTLSPSEESRAKAALRDALERLIFGQMNPRDFDLEHVLAAVDAELLELVSRYVEARSHRIEDLRTAVQVLQDLADNGTGANLTDDQEARLSVLCQVASETTKRRRKR